MDYTINWSPEAHEDLEAIAEYIARDSEFYARAVVSKIISTAKKITDHPKVGRTVPEIEDESIREIFVYSYRLIYQIDGFKILVVAIIHGKRLLDNLNRI